MIPFETYNQIDSLQRLISDGIIDLSEGKQKISMIKEKEVKKIHNRAINQRSNGRYITKVSNGEVLKQITAYTYEDMIDKLFEHYFGLSNSTLETLYPMWIDYRRNELFTKEKTIKENGFLWNRHLKGQSITQVPIRTLSPIDFVKFFRIMTSGRSMTKKRFNDIKSVINGIFYYAIEKEIISHNPLNEINYKQFKYKPEKSMYIPYTQEERQLLLDYIPNDDLYSLAIKLDFYLVLRIGELKGLRFDDVHGNMICIQRFVNDKNKIEEDIKGHTSYGFRWLPLTPECLKLISTIKEMNPDSDYMFFRDGKPLATCTFNRRLKKYCSDLGLEYRSSHQIRFGNASILYQNGVSAPEMQQMLGHSTLSMTNHYLRNVVAQTETMNKINNVFG